MYDFTHCLSDSIEGITHSICTLEFDNNRELYDWVLDTLDVYRSQQIEFARLNLTYTVLSKRKLIQLVKEGFVRGWDDPRMPTLSALRRRGYTPESIRDFCSRIGVAKADSVVDYALLEHCVREDLGPKAPRLMAVLRPLKVVLTNYPEGSGEDLPAELNPDNEALGTRTMPFGRELYIEQDDFMENPPPKYIRLTPGGEVRLKNAYIIKCQEVVKDSSGDIVELRCTYDPDTKSGGAGSGRKVKGTIHWVAAAGAVPCEVRLYDHLFPLEDPETGDDDFLSRVNPGSLVTLAAYAEPALGAAESGGRFQFIRHGYFAADPDSAPGKPVFNRIVGLKDSWAKIQK